MQLQWKSEASARQAYPTDVSDEGAFAAPYLTLISEAAPTRTACATTTSARRRRSPPPVPVPRRGVDTFMREQSSSLPRRGRSKSDVPRLSTAPLRPSDGPTKAISRERYHGIHNDGARQWRCNGPLHLSVRRCNGP